MPLSRRHFLSGLSALTLGAAGAGLAGPGRAAGLVLEARETSARLWPNHDMAFYRRLPAFPNAVI